MPSTVVSDDDLTDGKITVLALMSMAGMIKSNSEGRKLIQQNGVSINDVKVSDVFQTVTNEDLEKSVIIKKGKKVFHKFTK